MDIVLATKNQGKVKEILEAFAGLDFDFSSLLDYPHIPIAEESGSSYKENAILKAASVAKAIGKTALADDSGLEVEALGWGPGIHSARYISKVASDQQRNERILSLVKGLPWEKRRACFRCCIAIITAEGQEYLAEGACYGFIAEEARGTGGFGYDPIFYAPEYGLTFAELRHGLKGKISHRAKALAQAKKILLKALSSKR